MSPSSPPRKSVIITGCSAGGAGAALAETFLKTDRYFVFATARTPSKVPQTLHTSPHAMVLSLDVTSEMSVKDAAEKVSKQTGGRLDVLINNAGQGLTMPALDVPLTDAKALFDLNYFGPLAMLQAFGEMLMQTGGCVANLSSVGGLIPFTFSSTYNASKAALISGSETWRLELAPLGVRVLTLLVGGIATNFLDNVGSRPLPEGSLYKPVQDILNYAPANAGKYQISASQLAEEILQHVESGHNGKVWVGGGVGMVRPMLWLFPQGIVDMMVENMKPFSKKLAAEHRKQ